MFKCGEFVHLLLTKPLALRRKIDAPCLVVGVERLDRASDGLRRHHHARAAAEGIIVALQMLILGVIADIHGFDRYLALILRSADDTLLKG